MTVKECAAFLNGSSSTPELLKAAVTCMTASDTRAGNKFRVIIGPMDMSTLDNDTGSEAFKKEVETQMVLPPIPDGHKLIYLPVKKGSNWSVYCINMVRQRINYLICSSNPEEPMDAASLCKPLLEAVNFKNKRVCSFRDWPHEPVPFKHDISSNDAGLLAMYFMENYNGIEFKLGDNDTKAWSKYYRKSILALLFLQAANKPMSEKKQLSSDPNAKGAKSKRLHL